VQQAKKEYNKHKYINVTISGLGPRSHKGLSDEQAGNAGNEEADHV
jgi:hypothetical protein